MKIYQDSPKNHDISYKNHEFPSKNAEVKANLQSCSSANPSELTVRPLGADPLLRGEVPAPHVAVFNALRAEELQAARHVSNWPRNPDALKAGDNCLRVSSTPYVVRKKCILHPTCPYLRNRLANTPKAHQSQRHPVHLEIQGLGWTLAAQLSAEPAYA